MNILLRNVYVVVLVSCMSVFLHSCLQDNCGKVKCFNEGVCVQGKCACVYGYEGELCNVQWYEKFAGQWSASENYRGIDSTWQHTINALYHRAADSFIVIGIPNDEDTVVCKRSAFKRFYIVNKKLSATDSIYSGEATLNDDQTVTGLYTFLADTVEKTVIFTWSR